MNHFFYLTLPLFWPTFFFFPPPSETEKNMRSSGVLSRRGGSTSIAALRRPSTVATKAALASVVPAAARRLTPAMVPLTTTPKTKTKKSIATPTRAISGDDTGLLTALSSAPPEAFAALAAGASICWNKASKCALFKGGNEKEKKDVLIG